MTNTKVSNSRFRVGDVVRFSNTGLIGDKQVDVRVHFLSAEDPKVYLKVYTFQNSIKILFYGGYERKTADFRFEFVESGTNTPVSFTCMTTCYDLDKYAGYTERIKIDKTIVDRYGRFDNSYVKVYEDDTHIIAEGTRNNSNTFEKNPTAAVGFVIPNRSQFDVNLVARKGWTGYIFDFDSEDFWC